MVTVALHWWYLPIALVILGCALFAWSTRSGGDWGVLRSLAGLIWFGICAGAAAGIVFVKLIF